MLVLLVALVLKVHQVLQVNLQFQVLQVLQVQVVLVDLQAHPVPLVHQVVQEPLQVVQVHLVLQV